MKCLCFFWILSVFLLTFHSECLPRLASSYHVLLVGTNIFWGRGGRQKTHNFPKYQSLCVVYHISSPWCLVVKNSSCFALVVMVTKQDPWLAKHWSKWNSKTKQPIDMILGVDTWEQYAQNNEAGFSNWLPW